MRRNIIKINGEYITLGQLLKLSGIAESGVDAKNMIYDEMVRIDGEVCTMRGKKLRAGDAVIVETDEDVYEITVE